MILATTSRPEVGLYAQLEPGWKSSAHEERKFTYVSSVKSSDPVAVRVAFSAFFERVSPDNSRLPFARSWEPTFPWTTAKSWSGPPTGMATALWTFRSSASCVEARSPREHRALLHWECCGYSDRRALSTRAPTPLDHNRTALPQLTSVRLCTALSDSPVSVLSCMYIGIVRVRFVLMVLYMLSCCRCCRERVHW